MSVRARFRGWWAMPFVAAVLLVAACDGSGSVSGTEPPQARVAAVDVALPQGYEPVVVTPWGEDLLIGSRAP